VVDGVFGKTAIRCKAVGAMALRHIAIVEARRVHALPAPLTTAAAGMDLDGDAIADPMLVDRRPELYNRPHVFVADCEVPVERQTPLDHGRYAVAHNLEIGRTNRHCIDSHQHLCRRRLGNRLVDQENLVGPAQHPGLHTVRDRKLVAEERLIRHRAVPWVVGRRCVIECGRSARQQAAPVRGGP